MLTDPEKEYSVRILPVRITGKRWACSGGSPGELPISPPHQLALSESRGVIIYGWHTLGEEQKEQLVKTLKETLCD